MTTTNHSLGQYFTTDLTLQRKVYELIKNNPVRILEPSVGRGDLVQYILDNDCSIKFDMYEIDPTIEMLPDVPTDQIIFGDFLEQVIDTRYQTIIGNPPYVQTGTRNLYISFIDRCIDLLQADGELIFIVPSDVFKLTSASDLLNRMLQEGIITHIYHPHDEHLFTNASIDIVVFRYQKTPGLESVCLYNDEQKYVINNNGMITFSDELESIIPINTYFDVYVGLVSGKEEIYKSASLGNIQLLNGNGKYDSYIYLTEFPGKDDAVNDYLLEHKEVLKSRKIRKFTDTNWYQWGAPRNVSIMETNKDTDCIYMYNLTRKSSIAFIDKVQYFGGNLIMVKPKSALDLDKIVEYFNSDDFKKKFMFSGRFKIGQRQLANMQIPATLFQ